MVVSVTWGLKQGLTLIPAVPQPIFPYASLHTTVQDHMTKGTVALKEFRRCVESAAPHIIFYHICGGTI